MSDGIKYDEGKPKIGMVVKYFGPALMEVAKAGTFGCAKYGNGKFWDYNWNKVENGVERYTDALMRHLLKEDTEQIDPETGILHASLVAWNALARLVLILISATTQVNYYPHNVYIDEGIPKFSMDDVFQKVLSEDISTFEPQPVKKKLKNNIKMGIPDWAEGSAGTTENPL
jgi:hypothetical protein